MSLLRRRAKSRSCPIHGDNGCELQGEAGPRDRAQDKRHWRKEVDDETNPPSTGEGRIAFIHLDERTINAIKPIAESVGLDVSAWVRWIVDSEIRNTTNPVYQLAWCADMTGPHGPGGPCVMPSGHHHRDGIGGEWPVSMESNNQTDKENTE